MKKVFFILLIVLLVPLKLRAEVLPDQLVRTAVDKINQLRADRDVDPDDPRRLYVMMDICEEVMPHIDFRAMAKSVLGPQWPKATKEQRARFAREFRNLVVRTYSAALRKHREQQIIYLPFHGQRGDTTAVMKTEVKPAEGGPNVQINYSFYKKHSVWKMYDISIDGVSLVTTYRATYADLIRKEGIDALIAGIAKSNSEPPSAERQPSESKPAESPPKGAP